MYDKKAGDSVRHLGKENKNEANKKQHVRSHLLDTNTFIVAAFRKKYTFLQQILQILLKYFIQY